jgi:BirA family transcriptional regulator, biotin operon repressor / biotin---[acetyl-CoA-carboxylase] ligase
MPARSSMSSSFFSSSSFSLDRFNAAIATLQQQNEATRQPLGFEVRYVDRLDSTNTEVWRRLNLEEAKPGATTIAGSQTAGRGQWSRSWQSDHGGLYLSTLLAPHLPTAESAQLTFASAWGIAMNLRDRGIPVELKWPNDLLLKGRKLGGILTEIRTQAEMITHAVVGVGLNWQNSTPETGISLAEFWASQTQPASLSLELLGAIVLSGIARGYYYWQTHGIEAGTAAYEALLFHRGRTIAIQDRSVAVLGVTIDGKLRVCSVQNGVECEITFAPGSIQLGYDAQ